MVINSGGARKKGLGEPLNYKLFLSINVNWNSFQLTTNIREI